MKIKVRKYRVTVWKEGVEKVKEIEGAYCGRTLKSDVRRLYEEGGYKVLHIKILEYGTIYTELPKFYSVDECEFKEVEINE